MFATSHRFFPGDHQPSTGSTTVYPSPAATDLRNSFVGMLCIPILHEAGSRNTQKVACDLIGLSQVVTGFESTILILHENLETCVDLSFCWRPSSISVASTRIRASSLSQSFKLSTDRSWPCSCSQQLYP